jgi:DNA-binding transcriptional LysR family regulator
LGFTASAAFNPVVSETIKRFRATFPHAELTLEEANTVKLLQSLEAGRLDAVFIRPGPATPAGMDLHRLANEATKIALPSDHPLASKKRLSMAELADEPFVLFPRAMGMSLYDEILHACQRAGFTPQLGQEAPQISSIVNLVAAGLGVSVVPASITQVRLTGVRYRDIAGQAPVARLAVATRTGNDTAVVGNLLRLLQAPRAA